MTGWPRIAAIASVLWAVGAVLAMRISPVQVAQKQRLFAYEICQPWTEDEPPAHSYKCSTAGADSDD